MVQHENSYGHVDAMRVFCQSLTIESSSKTSVATDVYERISLVLHSDSIQDYIVIAYTCATEIIN